MTSINIKFEVIASEAKQSPKTPGVKSFPSVFRPIYHFVRIIPLSVLKIHHLPFIKKEIFDSREVQPVDKDYYLIVSQ